MKKLMIVAALAAMTGSVFADTQVYDVKLKVKTTTCKSAKLSQALADLGWFGGSKGDAVAFRGSATRKMAGLIWGCYCDTISRPSWRLQQGSGQGVGGYVFWDQTKAPYTAFQIPYTTFDWAVLNRVGKMKNVEGAWILGDTADGEAFYFLGAGFGTCTLSTANDCQSYIKTMSGNFGGFMQFNYDGSDGCIFCGESATGCLVAPFCVCYGGAARDTRTLTVAYGSWQIKYNSKNSKSLKTKKFITDVRNFTSAKYANIGAALDAAYEATLTVANAAATGADFDVSKVKTSGGYTFTDVASTNLVVKGNYYTELAKAKANYKKATLSTKNPGSVTVTTLPSVAGALIKSLGHVEAAADAGDEGDDWGDDDGDDWGDDDGDDDWDF